MVKLPMDLQRTKESSAGCQRSSSSQQTMFKAFPLAMAVERHDGGARRDFWRRDGRPQTHRAGPCSACHWATVHASRRGDHEGGGSCATNLSVWAGHPPLRLGRFVVVTSSSGPIASDNNNKPKKRPRTPLKESWLALPVAGASRDHERMRKITDQDSGGRKSKGWGGPLVSRPPYTFGLHPQTYSTFVLRPLW